MYKRVAVLLVIYNEEKHIKRLAESLNKQSYKAIDVYAVDNNSQDNSVELLKKYLPNITLIKSNTNNGFAKGNNIIAKKAINDGNEYIFVLNTDMELDTNCIKILVNYFNKNAKLGLLTPIVLYGTEEKKTNIIQSYADKANFDTARTVSLYGNKLLNENELPFSIEVNTVHGGTTFMKTEVYKEVGLFNEDNFMYGDELDLAFRIKNTGYKMLVTKEAKAWHFHDWSKRNKNGYYLQYYYMNRNRILFFYRYKKYYSIIKEMLLEILLYPVKIKWAIKTADIKLLKYYYLGIWHGLLNKKGKAKIEFK